MSPPKRRKPREPLSPRGEEERLRATGSRDDERLRALRGAGARSGGRGESTSEAGQRTADAPSSGPAGHLLPEGEGKIPDNARQHSSRRLPRTGGDDGQSTDAATRSRPRTKPHTRHSRESGNSVSSQADKPSDWRESQLGKEIRLQYGKSLRADRREAGTFNVYGSNGVVGHHSEPAVEGPGIIVGRKGSVGEIVYSPKDFWPIDTTYYVESNRDNNWLFIYYLLTTQGLSSLNTHSAVPGLNRESVYPIRCLIPPEPEQQKIAALLWKLQRAIATQDKLIKATGDLKQSAMQRLFTHGLRDESTRETRFGDVPSNWSEQPLGTCCHVQTGITKGRKIAAEEAIEVPTYASRMFRTGTWT